MTAKFVRICVIVLTLFIAWLTFAFPTVYAANNCTWTGTVSTDWANASNWDNCIGASPGYTDTATIGSVVSGNYPTVSATTSVGTVTINNGGTLTYNGGTGVTFDISTFNINDGGRYIHNSGTTKPVTGNNRTFATNSTVEIKDWANSTGSALPAFGNLTINAPGAVQLSGYLNNVKGNLTKKDAGDFRLATTQVVSLDITGNFDIQAGTVTIQSGTTSNTASINLSGNMSLASGTTFQRGTSATVLWSFAIGGNWSNNGTWTPGNSSVTFNKIGTATLSKNGVGSTETFNNVTINSSTILNIGDDFIKATGTFTNNGTLERQSPAQDLSSGAKTYKDALGADTVIITQTSGALGNTSVSILMNQSIQTQTCGGQPLGLDGNTVTRSWDITPAGTGSALVKLYIPDGELNGNTIGNLAFYHCNGTDWEKIATTSGSDGGGNYIQGEMSSFSPLGAGPASGTTAVTLSSFTAHTPNSNVSLSIILSGLGIFGLASFWLARNKRG